MASKIQIGANKANAPDAKSRSAYEYYWCMKGFGFIIVCGSFFAPVIGGVR